MAGGLVAAAVYLPAPSQSFDVCMTQLAGISAHDGDAVVCDDDTIANGVCWWGLKTAAVNA